MNELYSMFAAAQAGDRSALEGIVEFYRSRLESFIWSRLDSELRGRVDMEAVIHDTSLRALSSIRHVESANDEVLLPWLCEVAQEVVLAHARRFLRLDSTDAQALAGEQGSSSGQPRHRHESYQRLKSCLQSLPNDQQQVFRLIRIRGLSIRETAEKTGYSENAIVQLLWTATRQLRESWGDTADLPHFSKAYLLDSTPLDRQRPSE